MKARHLLAAVPPARNGTVVWKYFGQHWASSRIAPETLFVRAGSALAGLPALPISKAG